MNECMRGLLTRRDDGTWERDQRSRGTKRRGRHTQGAVSTISLSTSTPPQEDGMPVDHWRRWGGRAQPGGRGLGKRREGRKAREGGRGSWVGEAPTAPPLLPPPSPTPCPWDPDPGLDTHTQVGVASEEGGVGGGLVPPHQELVLRVVEEAPHVRCARPGVWGRRGNLRTKFYRMQLFY